VQATAPPRDGGARSSATFTIPLTLTIDIGTPVLGGAPLPPSRPSPPSPPPRSEDDDRDEGEEAPAASYADRRGYREDGGKVRLDYDPKIGDAVREVPPPAPGADPWPLFERLKDVPTVVLRGGLSDILEQDVFEEMGRRIPDARLVLVPNRGHVPLLDEPEVTPAIDQLLRDADAKA
jgi:pimeloyl-ACP methyl ester carboxylesterase